MFSVSTTNKLYSFTFVIFVAFWLSFDGSCPRIIGTGSKASWTIVLSTRKIFCTKFFINDVTSRTGTAGS